jgi:hypothetical protein
VGVRYGTGSAGGSGNGVVQVAGLGVVWVGGFGIVLVERFGVVTAIELADGVVEERYEIGGTVLGGGQRPG